MPSLRSTSSAAFAAALATLASLTEIQAGQSNTAAQPVLPGTAVEGVLRPAEKSHAFEISLRSGDLLAGVHESPADAPTVRITAPSGEVLLELEEMWFGPVERFWVVAGEDGIHRIELLLPKSSSVVAYQLRVEPPRPAGRADRLRAEAQKAHASASVPYSRKEWQEVEKIYEKARRLWSEADDARGEAQALHMLGYGRARIKDDPGAIVFYERALELRRVAGDQAGEAGTLKGLGEIYKLASRFSVAEELYDRSLALLHSAGDRAGEAGVLTSQSTLVMMRGDYTRALDLLRDALAIQEHLGDIDGQARSLSNMSVAHRSLGDLNQALDCAERSLPMRRQVGDRRGEAYTLDNLATIWLDLGEPEKALELLQLAHEADRDSGDRVREAVGLLMMAKTQIAVGDEDAAFRVLEQALSLSRAIRMSRLEGRALSALGDLLARRGDHLGALERYGLALAVMESAEDRTNRAATLDLACKSRMTLGELEAAERLCREALELSRELRLAPSEAAMAVSLADVEQRRGRLREAAARLENAFATMEALRDRVPPGERASFLANRQEPYRFWLDVLAALDREAPSEGWGRRSFHAAERMKARAFLEEVVESGGDLAGSLDPNLGLRRRKLEARLAGVQRLLSSAGLPESERRGFESELVQAEEEYEKLVREIRARAPARASLRYPEPARAEETQASLDPKSALIIYALGRERAYAFVLTRDTFRAIPLPGAPVELEARVRNYVDLLSRESDFPLTRMEGRLSRELLAPLAPAIPKDVRRLVIVPDGPLHALPFEALPAPRGRGRLLEQFAVSYSPSATVHAALRRARNRSQSLPLLVFADPASGRPGAQTARLRSFFEGEGLLGSLPHAQREARALSRFASEKSEVYVGADASERRAKERAGAGFEVLHFATHGLVSERNPSRSAILLAPAADEDGFLQAREISSLRSAAGLVVLSGCRTARGRLLAGEGAQSLARAFFQAGARSVVASLWDVQDAATGRLMEHFYGGLALGLPKSVALQEAKLAMQRQGHPPGQWAAFVLLGEGDGAVRILQRPLWERLVSTWPAGAILLVVAAGAALGIRRLRRRRDTGPSAS